jgi:hypothetical protein
MKDSLIYYNSLSPLLASRPVFQPINTKYWSTIELHIILHKQIYIHKRMWTMLGMRWSPSPLNLSFIAFFLFGSYKYEWDMGTLSIPQTLWLYSNLVHLYNSNIYYSMTTGNLMFYFQYSHFTSSQRLLACNPMTLVSPWCLSFLSKYVHYNVPRWTILQIYFSFFQFFSRGVTIGILETTWDKKIGSI